VPKTSTDERGVIPQRIGGRMRDLVDVWRQLTESVRGWVDVVDRWLAPRVPTPIPVEATRYAGAGYQVGTSEE
jgi:hypothetical protein